MGWTLDDIRWAAFDPAAVDPNVLALVKAAALVEANAPDYVAYLRGVFAGEDMFLDAIERWGSEETQHGAGLVRWATLADPGWDFATALAIFRAGYGIATDAALSIRGSRAGELIARQVVETGTSSFYTALRDASTEPVLRQLAGRIAADEFAHYRLFARAAAGVSRLPLHRRLAVAARRLAETGDDELGWAWFAANVAARQPSASYRPRTYNRAYAAAAMRLYGRPHIETGVRMTLRAISLRSDGALSRWLGRTLWGALRLRRAFSAA